MSVLTPKRLFLCVVAVFLGTTALANHPSPRALARMAYDEQKRAGVMFGGRGHFDGATGTAHGSSETWLWTNGGWVQQFPTTVPPGRSAHSMVYDSGEQRVLMFGGRVEVPTVDGEPIFLDDFWAYQNGDWHLLGEGSAERPGRRLQAGLAYDSDRKRVVLFGGNQYAADGSTVVGTFDTWEFDGETWTRIATDAPRIAKPTLVYDATAKKTVMLGVEEVGAAVAMYTYDSEAGSWQKVTPEKLPTCVNEGHLFYQEHNGRLLFIGGLCVTGTPDFEEAFEWDGTTWTKLTIGGASKGFGQASMWDPVRDRAVFFGGESTFIPGISSSTTIYRGGRWSTAFTNGRPGPRSLHTLVSDPQRNVVYLSSGLAESGSDFFGDLWRYTNGQWNPVSATGGPSACENPGAAYDINRGRLVVTCMGTTVYEFDGEAWKSFASLSPAPDARRFSSLVYDETLKKVVMFGGYINSNYRNDTWTWDGTRWTEIDTKKDSTPTRRGLMGMWYDPLQKRTILYGGFGRENINEKISRFSDMWAFNGTGWTKLSVAETPGMRFGPQIGVNPMTGKVLLFGGLRAENLDEDSFTQFYGNDTWEWDGSASKWTRLEPATLPLARENGAMAWDPSAQKMVMFGGYALGFYRSDTWTWDGLDWTAQYDDGVRRRAVR